MKMTKPVFIMIILILMLSMSYAQRMGRGWGYHCNYMFDLNSPVMIQGLILKVEKLDLGRGRYANGIRLIMKSDKKEIPIYIGPAAFLNSNNFGFKEGETVKIKAFKGTNNTNTALFALEVHKSGKNLVLRDKNGLPMWRWSLYKGRGRRGRRMY